MRTTILDTADDVLGTIPRQEPRVAIAVEMARKLRAAEDEILSMTTMSATALPVAVGGLARFAIRRPATWWTRRAERSASSM